MSRVKKYNCQEYSLYEIIEFLEKSGYACEVVLRRGILDKVHVVGTDVSVDIPYADSSIDQIFSDFRFEDYPKTERYEDSQKLFRALSRKFGKKKMDRKMQFIKDEHLNKEIYKRLPKVGDDADTKKGWKFWK